MIVIAGKDKGKEGTVLKVFRKENKVLVEGINKVKNIKNQVLKMKQERLLK